MLKYDEQAIKQKLKMEIGCADVPDIELWKHKVILNSPVKGEDTMSLNAAEYVSKGLEEYKLSVNAINQEIAEDDANHQEYNIRPLDKIPQLEMPSTEPQINFRVFDVGYGVDHFVVGVNMDYEDAKTQVDIIQSNFTYIKERQISDITSVDIPISYYQWHTWMTRLDRPVSTGVFDIEDLESKLKFVFEGVDDSEFAEAKKFI